MDVQKVQSLMNMSAEHVVSRNVGKMFLSFALLMSLLFSNPPSIDLFFHFPSRIFLLLNDKNYVFLLCNGIIVILANSYLVFTSFDDQSSPHQPDEIQGYTAEESSGAQPLQPIFSTADSAVSSSVPLLEPEDEGREFAFNMINAESEVQEEEKEEEEEEELQEEEKQVLVDGPLQDEEVEEEMEVEYEFSLEEESLSGGGKENNDWFHEENEETETMEYSWNDEEEQSEEERYIASMSTEDLNRKFEEFIRKMKEEIRIEARSQLVMV